MKIYLAGGMYTNWREVIKLELGSSCFFDPIESGFSIPEYYTAYDLLAIRNCDILVGYLEKDNPSGIGLSAEIGYAKALNKLIILVDEKNDKYTQFIRVCADIICENLDDMIYALKRLWSLYT